MSPIVDMTEKWDQISVKYVIPTEWENPEGLIEDRSMDRKEMSDQEDISNKKK